jgi:hypothetical protein
MQNEIWKDIKGYEERYQISNLGNVKSLLKDQLMKLNSGGGYLRVKLFNKEQKTHLFTVHNLVATHFVENKDPNKNKVIDHIDHNKQNNKASNLRWTTSSGNSKAYHDQKKDNSGKIEQYDLDGKLIKVWDDIKAILKENKDYNRNTLTNNMRGNRKTAYNFVWKKLKIDKEIVIEKDEIFKNVGKIDNNDFSLYDVSNYGKVKNVETKKYLKPAIGTNGYQQLSLLDKTNKNKINMKVHRLVALVFIEGRTEEKNYVNHIDENKLNNHHKNLEWMTNTENIIHTSGKSVDKLDIKTGEIIKTYPSLGEAQRDLKLTHSMHILKCCQGKKKTGYGFKWQYHN